MKKVTGTTLLTAAVGLLVIAVPASAAITIPEDVTDMFTDVATLVTAVAVAVTPIWIALKGSSVIFSLGNKFMGKAGAK